MPRITGMTNFRIIYISCVSKISRETDMEIKIAKNIQTSLRKATRVKLELKQKTRLVLFTKNRFSTYVMNEQTHRNGQQNLFFFF